MLFLLGALFPSLLSAFMVAPRTTLSTPKASFSSALTMAPRYDAETARWSPTSPDEEPSAGYNALGTFIRQGPKPFLQRLLTPDEYEQAVLKFMAKEQCSRGQAQGNMDAYFRNPQDWVAMRIVEERTGRKMDYETLSPQEFALRLVWTTIVFAVVGRVVYTIAVHDPFWDTVLNSLGRHYQGVKDVAVADVIQEQLEKDWSRK